jgi:ribosome-binding protein aMBF1 (putative translation factor)
MHSEMSESRFRGRISQERRTEGWKREKLKQKTTVKSVVVKIDLGGERKRREEFKGNGRQKR